MVGRCCDAVGLDAGCDTSIPCEYPQLAAPLLIQVPTNVPRKAEKDDLSAWVPVTQLGVFDGVPGPWL